MLLALFWGGLAAASLLLGAAAAFVWQVSDRALGLVLAFGAGVLMSSVAYELVEQALSLHLDAPIVAIGFAAGALVFYLGSRALDRQGGGSGATASGTAIVLGAVLDGIPESVVLGLTLVGGSGVSVAFLAAVFISNLPEALGASAELLRGGMSRMRVFRLWVVVVTASALAAAIGYGVLAGAPDEVVAATRTFAAGAIIAMLAESMMPEAFQKGGKAVGLATALGFALSALLSFGS